MSPPRWSRRRSPVELKQRFLSWLQDVHEEARQRGVSAEELEREFDDESYDASVDFFPILARLPKRKINGKNYDSQDLLEGFLIASLGIVQGLGKDERRLFTRIIESATAPGYVDPGPLFRFAEMGPSTTWWDRWVSLRPLFLDKPPGPVIGRRLEEASRCYVMGCFQGAAALCRVALELGLEEQLEKKRIKSSSDDLNLKELIEKAAKFGVIEERAAKDATALRKRVNSALHERDSLNEEETLDILEKTKDLFRHIFENV
jgi:hypothetical protein